MKRIVAVTAVLFLATPTTAQAATKPKPLPAVQITEPHGNLPIRLRVGDGDSEGEPRRQLQRRPHRTHHHIDLLRVRQRHVERTRRVHHHPIIVQTSPQIVTKPHVVKLAERSVAAVSCSNGWAQPGSESWS